MSTYTKVPLSPGGVVGSGAGIAVVATSSPGTLIHTVSATAVVEEVWLYAVNYDTTDRKLTIQYAGTTANTNDIEFTVKAENGLYLVIPGLVLKPNIGTGEIRAHAATATSIVLYGYINRIT